MLLDESHLQEIELYKKYGVFKVVFIYHFFFNCPEFCMITNRVVYIFCFCGLAKTFREATLFSSLLQFYPDVVCILIYCLLHSTDILSEGTDDFSFFRWVLWGVSSFSIVLICFLLNDNGEGISFTELRCFQNTMPNNPSVQSAHFCRRLKVRGAYFLVPVDFPWFLLSLSWRYSSRG